MVVSSSVVQAVLGLMIFVRLVKGSQVLCVDFLLIKSLTMSALLGQSQSSSKANCHMTCLTLFVVGHWLTWWFSRSVVVNASPAFKLSRVIVGLKDLCISKNG